MQKALTEESQDKKKPKKPLIIVLTALVSVLVIAAVTLAVVFTGMTPKLGAAPSLDESIPLLSGNGITSAMNAKSIDEAMPDRGLRYELYITLTDDAVSSNDPVKILSATRAYPNAKKDDGTYYNSYEYAAKTLDRFRTTGKGDDDHFPQHEPFNFSVTQLYVYLCDFSDKELTSTAFKQLQTYLESLRATGLRALIRFAYEYDADNLQGPTSETMFRHMEQIKEWLAKSSVKTLINDTVTAFQAGFVGLWGEWHGSLYQHDGKKVMENFYSMVPEGMYMQVRTAEIRDMASKKASANLGYHDDFETGGPNKEHTAGSSRNSSRYKTFLKNSPTLINDGEMPWGTWSATNNQYVSGKAFIKSMFEHRYATFSAEHNFYEGGGLYSMIRWMDETVTEQDLIKMQVPYNTNYFKDKNGGAISRTVFDYVRDHLGYQLVASNLTVLDETHKTNPDKLTTSTIQFTVSNFGVGAPLTIDTLEVVFATVIDGEIRVFDKNYNNGLKDFHAKLVQPQWSPIKLTTYGTLEIVLENFERDKGFAVGIKIYRDDSRKVPVRLANDIPFYNGVNFIWDYGQLGL